MGCILKELNLSQADDHQAELETFQKESRGNAAESYKYKVFIRGMFL